MADRAAAHAALRAATADDHARLDARLGQFDLADADQYRAFLIAHARALPAVEAALDAGGFAQALPDWPDRRRTDALAADLAALDEAMPAPLAPPVLAERAAQWGAAYVVEGSRLGGALLARQVGDGLPRAYLGAAQPAGAWRAFLAAMDAALPSQEARETAADAARATFALFARAAG